MPGLPWMSYYNRLIEDSPTITSNSENSDYPDDNVAEPSRVDIYRATGDTAEWLKFDFAAAKTFTCICVDWLHNFTGSATVNLEFNSSDSWSPPAATEALTVAAGKAIVKRFTSKNYRWVRLTVADASNPDTYIEIPHLWLGEWQDLTTHWGEYRDSDVIPAQAVLSTIHTRRRYKQGARHKAWRLPWELKTADVAIYDGVCATHRG